MELTSPCKKIQWCLEGGVGASSTCFWASERQNETELSMCRVSATLTSSQGWLSVWIQLLSSTWTHLKMKNLVIRCLGHTVKGPKINKTFEEKSWQILWPTALTPPWCRNTPRLSSAEHGENTLAIYSVSVLIFVSLQHSGHWPENVIQKMCFLLQNI